MKNANQVDNIIDNIEKVIVGKKTVIELCLVTMLAGGHLLLEDVPGVGKTTLAKAMAQTVHCGFTRIQFTPDTLPSDVTGMSIYNMNTGKFDFMQGAIMNHLILADEINRTSPKTQSSLLEAMEEGQVTVDGITYKLPVPFMVIATQNPIEQLGTYHLPEAQLDRFMMKLSLGYPEEQSEIEMVHRFFQGNTIKELPSVVELKQLIAIKEEVNQVVVHEDIVSFCVSIIEKTRKNVHLTLGASPRATLALLQASKAYAYLKKRDYVIPDDVKIMAEYVLPHRFILSSEARVAGLKSIDVLQEILRIMKVPVIH